MVKTIPKKVLQGLKSVVAETMKQTGEEVKTVIGLEKKEKSEKKPVDLLPDISVMSQDERSRLEATEKAKRKKELGKVRKGLFGRDVAEEIDEVRRKKKKKEEDEERLFLEKIRRQRREEAEEKKRLMVDLTPAHKKKKSRGSAFARGKKPTASEMSATGEFNRKKD